MSLRRRVLLALANVLRIFPANLGKVDVGRVGRRGLAETSGGTLALGNIARDTAAADGGGAGVSGLPVGGDGGLLGKGKVGLDALNLLGLGLVGHFWVGVSVYSAWYVRVVEKEEAY